MLSGTLNIWQHVDVCIFLGVDVDNEKLLKSQPSISGERPVLTNVTVKPYFFHLLTIVFTSFLG